MFVFLQEETPTLSVICFSVLFLVVRMVPTLSVTAWIANDRLHHQTDLRDLRGTFFGTDSTTFSTLSRIGYGTLSTFILDPSLVCLLFPSESASLGGNTSERRVIDGYFLVAGFLAFYFFFRDVLLPPFIWTGFGLEGTSESGTSKGMGDEGGCYYGMGWVFFYRSNHHVHSWPLRTLGYSVLLFVFLCFLSISDLSQRSSGVCCAPSSLFSWSGCWNNCIARVFCFLFDLKFFAFMIGAALAGVPTLFVWLFLLWAAVMID